MADRRNDQDRHDTRGGGAFGDDLLPDPPDFAALEELAVDRPPASLEELRGLLVDILDEKIGADTSCGHLHPADVFQSLRLEVDVDVGGERVELPPAVQDRYVASLNTAVLLDERAVEVMGRLSGPDARVEDIVVSIEYPEEEAPLLWVAGALAMYDGESLSTIALVESAWDVVGDCLHPLEPQGAGGLVFATEHADLDPSVLHLYLPDRNVAPRSRLQGALEQQYDDLRNSLRDRALFWLARTSGEGDADLPPF